VEDFETLRPLLFAIAYRMLGSVGQAEDIVQETYVRYQAVPPETIQSLKAFLTTITTRLAIDALKSAQAQRETYFGEWLPEPLLTDTSHEPAARAELNESLSIALLVLLEKLNPVERAVFLLREVFDYEYATISAIVGKSESACRQSLHRARAAVHHEKPRYHSTAAEHHLIFYQFLQACVVGDMHGLEAVLAADVVALSDGGGKASAATRPVLGAAFVSAFVMGLFKKAPAPAAYEIVELNGRTSLIIREGGTVTTALMADIRAGTIHRLWFVRNPDKLHPLH